jgi:hypothetical protein
MPCGARLARVIAAAIAKISELFIPVPGSDCRRTSIPARLRDDDHQHKQAVKDARHGEDRRHCVTP